MGQVHMYVHMYTSTQQWTRMGQVHMSTAMDSNGPGTHVHGNGLEWPGTHVLTHQHVYKATDSKEHMHAHNKGLAGSGCTNI